MDISLPPSPPMPVGAEIMLLERALGRDPAMAAVRDRLAALLMQRDAFAEAVALLTDERYPPLDHAGQMALAAALFARAAPGDDDAAAAAADTALTLATSPAQVLAATGERARADLRRGDDAAAIERLQRALAEDPTDIRSLKYLGQAWLRRGDAAKLLRLTDRLLAHGVRHARLLAARTLALAATGDTAAARALADEPAFRHAAPLPVPPGWPDAAAFHARLIAELMANPDLRFGRHGTASKASWRVDDPILGNSPAVTALLRAIADAVVRHAATLAPGHLWTDARPARAMLQCWCVITEAEGHERWHMHPDGWLSGGYYVAVPESVAAGSGPAGCLAIGVPGGVIAQAAATAFGETLVRPRPGLLTLFPSHAHHRTYAHGGDGRRICFAFDVCPI